MSTRTTNPWGAMGALCIGFFMILLDTTIVSIAIPAMLTGLGASLNSVIWVSSVYLLTYAVPMLFASRLGDRFGPRRVFLVGLVVFTLASLWCGLAGSVEMLILARGVQGLGAALMTPQTLSFVTHLFPPNKRGAAMGVWGAVAGLATITGPLLGGVLVDRLGWEWIFFVNVPIGVVGLVLTLLLVPDWQPKNSHSFDVPGILLSAAGLFCVVFGLQNGQHYEWGTVTAGITVFEIIGAGVLLLIGFVLWQRHNRAEPLVPLTIFANRTFSAGVATATTVGFAMTTMFLPLVIYVQSARDFTPTMFGLFTLPMCLMQGIVAPFIGKLADRINGKYLLMFGLAMTAAGMAIIAAVTTPTTNPWSLIPALLVCGIGIGSIFAPMSALIMGSVPPTLAGTASGIYNTARQVGGVLGSAAVGVLLQARIVASIRDHATEAAAALPEQVRAPFIDRLTSTAGAGSEFAGTAPPEPLPGVDPDLAAQIQRLATEAVHHSLTDAARASILLPVTVLLIGVVCAAMMHRTSKSTEREPAMV